MNFIGIDISSVSVADMDRNGQSKTFYRLNLHILLIQVLFVNCVGSSTSKCICLHIFIDILAIGRMYIDASGYLRVSCYVNA